MEPVSPASAQRSSTTSFVASATNSASTPASRSAALTVPCQPTGPDSLLPRIIRRGIREACAIRIEIQMHCARRAVTLLGENDLRARLIFLAHLFIAVVIRLAVDERHHIGILFDRARLTQIA